MTGKVTTNKAALQMVATHLELTKAKDKFVSPIRDHYSPEGPAFMPYLN